MIKDAADESHGGMAFSCSVMAAGACLGSCIHNFCCVGLEYRGPLLHVNGVLHFRSRLAIWI